MTATERYSPLLLHPAAEEAATSARTPMAELHEIEALVPAYSALLFRVAHALLRNRAEAEDVVQDTFLRVLGQRGTLHEVRDMRVWLVRIAWRLALDRKRRTTPGQLDDAFAQALVAHSLPADQALAETREVERTLRAIDTLPSGERAALLLCAMDAMTTREIAAVLGKSESAVRALLFRARTRLVERLAASQRRSAR